MNKAFIYMLASKRNGTLYIGATTDLVKRIWQHKNKIVPGFTSQYNVDKLVYYEEHAGIVEAYAREKRLKEWPRIWKVRVIESFNPGWKDLFEVIAFY